MKYIDKSMFNKLSIKEQVKIFNELLEGHNNIKEVCEYIGIAYSTIRDRFYKHKYIYNKHLRKYEYNFNKNRNLELEKMIENIINNIDRKQINPFELSNMGDITIRSFRIYENVLLDFIEFCNNSSLKQYDVLSIFIMEGLEKYNKR